MKRREDGGVEMRWSTCLHLAQSDGHSERSQIQIGDSETLDHLAWRRRCVCRSSLCEFHSRLCEDFVGSKC